MPSPSQIDDCPNCFGKQGRASGACKICTYHESCQYVIDNPSPDSFSRDSKGHHVSIEQYGYAEEISDVPDMSADIEREEEQSEEYDTPVYSNADMKNMLEFILRGVDDYTLAIVECVLRENHSTASQVAKAFDVSREAIHRKLVDSCIRYPFLREVLRCVLYRCKKLASPANRSAIAGRRVHQPQNNGGELQMEFQFDAKP